MSKQRKFSTGAAGRIFAIVKISLFGACALFAFQIVSAIVSISA